MPLPEAIGLLGGTFDPVHKGHIVLAQASLTAFHLERILFIPAGHPWQKHLTSTIASRKALLEIALRNYPKFTLDTRELTRDGETYTIDTLKELRELYGPDVSLTLILGTDQWENLPTWKHWKEFLCYANIAIGTRNGKVPHAPAEVSAWAEPHYVKNAEIKTHANGAVSFFTVPPIEASSSKIRSIFQSGDKTNALLAKWLDSDVLDFILKHNLYS